MPRAKSKPKKQTSKRSAPSRQGARGIKLDPENLREDIRNAGGGNYFQWPDSGKAKVRLIPYEHNGRGKLFFKTVQHWQPTPDIRGSVTCGGHDCGLCQLRASVADGNKDLKDHLRVRIQYLFNVVDKADKTQKIQIFRAPKTIWSKFVSVIQDTEEFPDACSFENGVDFIISKSGQGLTTKYDVIPSPKRSKIEPTGSVTNFDEQETNRESVDTKALAKEVADAYDETVPF